MKLMNKTNSNPIFKSQSSLMGSSLGFLVAALVVMISSTRIHADELGNLQLFTRCYEQLTQSFPDPENSIYKAVKSNAIGYQAACERILQSARFDQSAKADRFAEDITAADPEAVKVLRMFHNLHLSWFLEKTFPEIGFIQPNSKNYTRDIYDRSLPAAFFTKALFDSNFAFKDVFSSNVNLRLLRSDLAKGETVASQVNDVPSVGVYTGRDYLLYPERLSYVQLAPISQRGSILGVQTTLFPALDYIVRHGTDVEGTGVLYPNHTKGAGFLGTSAYLLMSVQEVTENRPMRFAYYADGADRVPRRWSKKHVLRFAL